MSISYIIPSFGLYCLAFLLGQPIPYLGLPWPISFFGRPRPISSFPTSFTPMGFLLNHSGFTGLITTSLPFRLIGLWANPMNLLIPFFRLPWPIFYFLSISYNSHGLTTLFLGLPRPICFLLGHLLSFVGLLTIISAILAQWSLFYYSLSLSFSYC